MLSGAHSRRTLNCSFIAVRTFYFSHSSTSMISRITSWYTLQWSVSLQRVVLSYSFSVSVADTTLLSNKSRKFKYNPTNFNLQNPVIVFGIGEMPPISYHLEDSMLIISERYNILWTVTYANSHRYRRIVPNLISSHFQQKPISMLTQIYRNRPRNTKF